MVGTIKTVESLGAAFSSLCGEQLAEVMNYSIAFGVLSVIAILPIIIYGFWMPSGKRNMFSGEMIEELSILPNQHHSSYTDSSYYEDDYYSNHHHHQPHHINSGNNHNNNIDCSTYSIDIDSSRTGLNHHHHHQQLRQQQEQQYQEQQYHYNHQIHENSIDRNHFHKDPENYDAEGVYLQDYNSNNNSNPQNKTRNINNNNNNNNKTLNQKNNDSSRGHTTTRQIHDRLSEM